MPMFLAESFLHDLDPFAVQFTDRHGLRWYGISYAAGFLVAWWLLRRLARTGRTTLDVPGVGDFMFYVIFGVLVGGRLGYALFYDPALFVDFSGRFPFWGLLAIMQGGMASHGGIIGVIVALWVFARRRGTSMLHLLDLAAFACPPGLFFGRIANFVNGELWGRALPASMQADPPWWSVKYPDEVLLWLDEPARATSLAALEPLRDAVGGTATFHEAIVAIARDPSHAAHERVVAVLQPLLTAWYPSQIFQALAEGPLLLGLLAIVWWRPRRPGVVGSWFLVLYGLLRIATEVFRQPDANVGPLFGAVSRGQALSALMIVAGAIAMALCARRPVERLGGLRPRRA